MNTLKFFLIVSLIILLHVHHLMGMWIHHEDNDEDFPQILTRTSNQTVNLSDTAVLTCHVVNLGTHHVTWLKYDRNTSTFLPLIVAEQVFISDSRYSIDFYSSSSSNSYWNLQIYNVQLSDEGIYQCKISNRRRSVSMQIHLSIHIPMSIQPAQLSVEPGSEVELDCFIYNINTSSITWHFVSSDQTYSYEHYADEIDEIYQQEKNRSKAQLIIRHAQPYHSGLWTCSYKRQKRSANLFVKKGAIQRLLSNSFHRSYSSSSISRLNIFIFVVLHRLTHH